MKILYVSTLCSDSTFKLLFKNSKVKPQQQAQKFHGLLSNGLAHFSKSIDLLSRPPINHSTSKISSTIRLQESSGNKNYHYLSISSNLVLRHFSLFFSSLVKTLRWNIENYNDEKVVICDILNVSTSISALISAKFCRVKSIAIVTDLPNYLDQITRDGSIIKNWEFKIYKTICNFFLTKYDYYVILTEQMNEIVNPKKNPFVVIEGMVDMKMNEVANILSNKYNEKIILYSGALYENYGIKTLIEAFIITQDNDARLWLFGDGDLVEEIKKYEKKDDRIRYFGVIPNEDMIQEQLRVSILVNPRPSSEEFTKYSFPSKNMEYMASGTPVLTTPLPGMPKEYSDYVYIFDDESVEGMSKTISKILCKKPNELHKKGQVAKEFAIKEKNNLLQAKKIIDLVRG